MIFCNTPSILSWKDIKEGLHTFKSTYSTFLTPYLLKVKSVPKIRWEDAFWIYLFLTADGGRSLEADEYQKKAEDQKEVSTHLKTFTDRWRDEHY